MVVPVVNCGVTPEPVTIDGETVPRFSTAEAPPPVLPVVKYEAVPDPPVPAGNEMVATGETTPPVTDQPPELRLTLTRA